MVKIPAEIISVIVGLQLSDGGFNLASKTNKNARLSLMQSFAHSGYFWFVFNYLLPFLSSIPTFVSGIRRGTKTPALFH
jgi:LAGLIDADG DNA endonuclease family